MSKEKTKLVRVTLSALTRVEYTEVVEVPTDFSESEIADLVDKRYDAVDGGEFYSDPDFWERGKSCNGEFIKADENEVVKVRFTRNADGDLEELESEGIEP